MTPPATETPPRPDGPTLAAFAVLVLIGGTNFVAVSVNVEEMPPLWGAGLRFLAASAVLLAYMGLRRVPFPRGQHLWGAVAYGVLGFTASYALLYWALQRVAAGVTAVVVSAVPLATLLLAIAHRIERFRLRGLLGSLLALAGIGTMYARSAGSGIDPVSLLAMLGGTVAIAESGVIAKRYARGGRVATNAVGMTTGAVLLLICSALLGEAWVLPSRTATWVSLVYLSLIGSIALFGAFLFVLGRWTASGTSYATVLFPVVTVALAAILGREPVTMSLVLGGVLVLAGVWVGALAPEDWLRRKEAVVAAEKA